MWTAFKYGLSLGVKAGLLLLAIVLLLLVVSSVQAAEPRERLTDRFGRTQGHIIPDTRGGARIIDQFGRTLGNTRQDGRCQVLTDRQGRTIGRRCS